MVQNHGPEKLTPLADRRFQTDETAGLSDDVAISTHRTTNQGRVEGVIVLMDTLSVIALFVDNPQKTKATYQRALGSKVTYEDSDSAVIELSNLIVNVLKEPNHRL